MSKADDDAFARLDLNEELKAAMAAEQNKKPTRATKRKGEPVVMVPAGAPVASSALSASAVGMMPESPQVAVIAPALAQPVTMQTQVASQVVPTAPAMPTAPVGPFGHAPVPVTVPQSLPVAHAPPVAPVAVAEPEPPAEPEQGQPTARQVSVAYTRAGRRPEGFMLPREDHRRRTQLSCAAKVLRPDEKQRFELVVPAHVEGPQELRSIQFPSFGAGRLLVEAILLDDAPIMNAPGSIAAEFFTPAARENATPFAILAAESKLTLVVHNVSPTPVPVHPSATIAALEPLRNAQG